MASTVLVKDVFSRVGVILQDMVPQWQRWPEHELVDWLNDGQMAITKFLPAACSRIDAIKLKAGTRQSIETILAADCKPGDGSSPSAPILGTQFLDVIRNMGADGQTPGKVIRVVERELLDTQNPTWHSVASLSVSSITYDPRVPRYFYVTPGVQAGATAVWVEIAYTAQPVRIPNTGTLGAELYSAAGASATTISIADEFVDDLVNYVVARANMKEMKGADKNVASMFSALFTGSLNSKVTALTGNNPNLKMLPFAPDPIAAAQ